LTDDGDWSFDGSGPLLRQRALDFADEAITRLGDTGSDRDKAIHDVRKRLKELRAVISLLRSHLDDHGRHDRVAFRDAGRRLAASRDAKAAVEAFDQLREHYAQEWGPGEFLKIRRALTRRLPGPISPDTVRGLTDTLLAARRRVAAWSADGIKQEEVWSAFRRSYRAARRAMSHAAETNRPELLHEWRKRVKAHWHHSELVTDAGLARLDKYAKQLHKLSDVLGEHHDLVVLDELLGQSPQLFGSPVYVARFLGFVGRRLRGLEERAASAGGELFAERPKAWEEQARASMLRHGPKRAERHYSHSISNVQVASPRH
jgi:CHAD domain-containing protein